MRKGNNRPLEMKGRWLLTFNDMMTLLFAFFVLIISMSHQEAGKIRGVAGSVRKVVGMEEAPGEGKQGSIKPFDLSLLDRDIERARRAEGVRPLSGNALAGRAVLSRPLQNLEGVEIIPLNNGFSLSFAEGLLFSADSAEILTKGRSLLNNLGLLLQRTDVSLCVAGYGDDFSGSTGKFPSPWELSLARAANIVRYLLAEGGLAPERLAAAGYGAAGAQVRDAGSPGKKRNRQVSIILTFPEY